MKSFCDLDAACPHLGGADTLGGQALELVQMAMATRISPSNASITRSVLLDLPAKVLAELDQRAELAGIDLPRYIGGLISAQLLQPQAPAQGGSANSPSAVSMSVQPRLQGLRESQANCLMEAASYLRQAKITMTECGTGTGKGRLIAHLVGHLLELRDAGLQPQLPPFDENDKHLPAFLKEHAALAIAKYRQRSEMEGAARAVIVCAPAIENVSHLAREWVAVRPVVDPLRSFTTAVLLGRAQFVSPSKLRERFGLLALDADLEPLNRWLDKGMPPGLTPSTTQLATLEPSLCGLMADLQQIATLCDLNLEGTELDDDCPEDEQGCYTGLRAKAMSADVVFTTQAMVCLDNLMLHRPDAPRLLPLPMAVLVDEAHGLESSQSAIAERTVSFKRLVRELQSADWATVRRSGAASKACQLARQAALELKPIPPNTVLPVSAAAHASQHQAWASARRPIADLAAHLRELTKPLKAKGKASKKTEIAGDPSPTVIGQEGFIARTAYALSTLDDGARGYLSSSTRRDDVTLTFGPRSVSKYLLARWATTPTAVLLSGSLMHVGGSGFTRDAFQHEMAIPRARIACTEPVHPRWLFTTPEVLEPDVAQQPQFIPPKGNSATEEELRQWMTAVSCAVQLAAQQAKGGTLVLMSSYDKADLLGELLLTCYPGMASRLLIQRRSTPIGNLSHKFKALYASSERPIWIASGPAWTGLDLSMAVDRDPTQDNLLTDLVIPAVPFGLDRGTTHFARVTDMGFYAELRAAQRRWRQGIGRLVRHEGVQNRRLWLLDGRLQLDTLRHMDDFRAVVRAYPNRRRFLV